MYLSVLCTLLGLFVGAESKSVDLVAKTFHDWSCNHHQPVVFRAIDLDHETQCQNLVENRGGVVMRCHQSHGMNSSYNLTFPLIVFHKEGMNQMQMVPKKNKKR